MPPSDSLRGGYRGIFNLDMQTGSDFLNTHPDLTFFKTPGTDKERLDSQPVCNTALPFEAAELMILG